MLKVSYERRTVSDLIDIGMAGAEHFERAQVQRGGKRINDTHCKCGICTCILEADVIGNKFIFINLIRFPSCLLYTSRCV